jgi:hypothetical protein
LGGLHKKSEKKGKGKEVLGKKEKLPPPPEEGRTLLRRVLRLRPLVLLIEVVWK